MTESKLTISTWLHCEPKDQESFYPQVGGSASSKSVQKIYWRCVVLFFASSLRTNPSCSYRFYTTAETMPIIDGFSLEDFFNKNNIEVVRVPFTYLPPAGYFGSWRNQFYILDIIKLLAAATGDEQHLVLDSDCIIVRPLDNLSSAIEEKGLIAYDTKFPADENINGLTRRDLGKIFREMGEVEQKEPPSYYGGEIFAADLRAIKTISEDIDSVWQTCLSRFSEGKQKFNEEAHLLSYLYYKHGYSAASANPFISRIWTGRKYRTASTDDFGLSIWHLPAEKKYGLARLFMEVLNDRSPFWTATSEDPFANFVAGFVGIPFSSPVKTLRDTIDALKYRAFASR